MGSSPPDIEALLSEARWAQRLARALLRPPQAEDLLQDTWQAALEAPPNPNRPVRGWLATVLRRRARRVDRAESRRRGAEAVAQQPDQPASPEEIALRFELQRRLASLVATLDEPYRAAILLRYYEGLSGAEIARRLGVPEGTIRWRVKEALARLRCSLAEQESSERRSWRLMLAPLASMDGAHAGSGTVKIAAVMGALAIASLVVTAARHRRVPPTAPGASALEVSAPNRRDRAHRPPRLAWSPGAAAPDSTRGLLTLTTSVPAIVYVDDEPIGWSPIERRELEPGPHLVRARAEDHRPSMVQIEVKPSQEVTLSLPLLPASHVSPSIDSRRAVPAPRLLRIYTARDTTDLERALRDVEEEVSRAGVPPEFARGLTAPLAAALARQKVNEVQPVAVYYFIVREAGRKATAAEAAEHLVQAQADGRLLKLKDLPATQP